ncbi:MAG TPA: PQQ-binding-like beta-propeller repeat protein [Vicinamibacteria bacterium]|nr:PQQ-binding-like beta-propeller repeat protein [Vicinamibacteria bacterium]
MPPRALAFLALASGVPLLAWAAGGEPAAIGHWPQFRGAGAAGVADGADLPDAWDGERPSGILWKARIPGLAHSSPVVWGDQVFVTTAVSSRPDATFKPGLYGEGTASEDRSVHRWQLLSLDKRTGKLLWERTAYEGEPREKRHVKATYANATPATDGRYVVAFFGSQGLYAYDLEGNLKWKRDLGRLDAGAYDAPDYEWGTASSPILHKDLVIVQCDQQKDSFLMALRLRDGEVAWKAAREELPSWATPTVYPAEGAGRAELVTNAPNFIRGYDPETGRERWRLGRSSQITAPTPVFDGDLIVVMSGRRPNAPIFVVKAGASGDITLPEGATAGGPVLWTRERAGSYMPTPLIYRGLLYVLKNQGILACYDLRSGEQKYEQRLPGVTSGFSASPVAADGRLYLPSEDGDVLVVKAGPQFELMGRNPMGQALMATPAISDGILLVRGERDLFAIGRAADDRR